MTPPSNKNGNHFSLEPLVRESDPKGGLHISTDTKRVALVLVLAVASFLTVYFLSGSGDDLKTQLRFADDGSASPVPTAETTPAPTAPGSLAYNGSPESSPAMNTNGASSTVIRNSAASNANGSNGNGFSNANANASLSTNANANAAIPTSGNVGAPAARPVASLPPTTVYPSATPLTTALGQYGVVGSAGQPPTPRPTIVPTAPASTPSPSPGASAAPSPTAEPIKRSMEPSGPAAWFALLPVVMMGVFRLVRKSA